MDRGLVFVRENLNLSLPPPPPQLSLSLSCVYVFAWWDVLCSLVSSLAFTSQRGFCSRLLFLQKLRYFGDFEECTNLVTPKLKHEDSQNGCYERSGDWTLGFC